MQSYVHYHGSNTQSERGDRSRVACLLSSRSASGGSGDGRGDGSCRTGGHVACTRASLHARVSPSVYTRIRAHAGTAAYLSLGARVEAGQSKLFQPFSLVMFRVAGSKMISSRIRNAEFAMRLKRQLGPIHQPSSGKDLNKQAQG